MNNISKNSDNHCRHSGSDYSFFRTARLQGYHQSELPQELQNCLANPDLLLRSAEILKNSKTTTAGLFSAPDRKYFIKRYNNKGFLHTLKYAFRRSRPLKTLDVSIKLSALGIIVPEVFAAGIEKKYFLPHCGYLVTESFPKPMTAADSIAELTLKNNFPNFVSGICGILKKMHDSGIAHGDLKMPNILCLKKPTDAFEYGLLDFDGAKISTHPLPRRTRIKELARVISSWYRVCRAAGIELNDTNAVKIAFINKYFEFTGHDLTGKKIDRRIDYLAGRVRKN
ncbi:MAG: lipopolysaccharide kinase InaA family protein [Victivallaceae bacterium]